MFVGKGAGGQRRLYRRCAMAGLREQHERLNMSDLSITGLSSSSQPFPRVQTAIQREAASGAISPTDQTAITAALDDIGSQLSVASGPSSGAASATTSTATISPTMKDRVSSLIDGEVSSGKLTPDQATALKGAFEQAHAHMHGLHGHHGGGGGLAALLGTDSSSTADGQSPASDTAAVSGTTNPLEAAATNAVSALESFITQFKSAVSSNAVYGANGSNGNVSPSLMINAIG